MHICLDIYARLCYTINHSMADKPYTKGAHNRCLDSARLVSAVILCACCGVCVRGTRLVSVTGVFIFMLMMTRLLLKSMWILFAALATTPRLLSPPVMLSPVVIMACAGRYLGPLGLYWAATLGKANRVGGLSRYR